MPARDARMGSAARLSRGSRGADVELRLRLSSVRDVKARERIGGETTASVAALSPDLLLRFFSSRGAANAQSGGFPSHPLDPGHPVPAGGPSDVRPPPGARLAWPARPVGVVERTRWRGFASPVSHCRQSGSDAHVMGMMSASAGAIMCTDGRCRSIRRRDIAPLTLRPAQEILWCRCFRHRRLHAAAAGKARPGKPTSRLGRHRWTGAPAIEPPKHEAGIDILHRALPRRRPRDHRSDRRHRRSDAARHLDFVGAHPRQHRRFWLPHPDGAPPLPDVPTMRELDRPGSTRTGTRRSHPARRSSSSRQKTMLPVETLHSKEVIDAFAAVGGVAVGARRRSRDLPARRERQMGRGRQVRQRKLE